MNKEIREKVLGLLKGYLGIQREITLLRYQLEHMPVVNGDEMIASMNFSHGDGQVGASNPGVSNKTQSIALNYQSALEKENAELQEGIHARIRELEYQKDTLDRWINLLEKREADVIRLYYCERKSWDETAEALRFSIRTTYRLREKAISELCETIYAFFPYK